MAVAPVSRKTRYPRNAKLTQARLQRAATRLFSERGYNGVSLNQIAARARVDKALVFHYYASKEELYAAALQDVYRRPDIIEERALEIGKTAPEKLSHLLEAMANFQEENPDYVRLLLWENIDQGRHIRKRSHLLGKSFFPRFEKIVRDGIAHGELRPNLVPEHLFINFIGLCFIYHSNRDSLARELPVDPADPKVRAKGLRQALKLVLEGVRAGKK